MKYVLGLCLGPTIADSGSYITSCSSFFDVCFNPVIEELTSSFSLEELPTVGGDEYSGGGVGADENPL